jgi:hypothetical protein
LLTAYGYGRNPSSRKSGAHKIGFWAIDIGHLDVEFMWMINNAKKKIPLIGRYVNEVANILQEELDDSFLTLYRSQIVDTIL